VEVCPNRANFAVPVSSVKGGDKASSFRQQLQILHVDALCNECGNCGVFCPYQGEPYRHKPTLFPSSAAARASKDAGFAFVGSSDEAGRGAAPASGYRTAYEGALRTVPFADWTAAAEKPAPAGDAEAAAARALLSLALTVHQEHRYLAGGPK